MNFIASTNVARGDFLPRNVMHKRGHAVVRCPSVCPSRLCILC